MWAPLILLAISPHDGFVCESVDRIEVNHVYASSGELRFDQIIFWRFNRWEGRYDCIDWRFLRGCRHDVTDKQRKKWRRAGDEAPPPVGEWTAGDAYPYHENRSGDYISMWYDEKTKTYREVRAPSFMETWTNYDPEVENRDLLPVSKRRKLR